MGYPKLGHPENSKRDGGQGYRSACVLHEQKTIQRTDGYVSTGEKNPASTSAFRAQLEISGGQSMIGLPLTVLNGTDAAVRLTETSAAALDNHDH